MPINRQDIIDSIIHRRQKQKTLEDELINVVNNVVCIENDGIERVIDENAIDNGYLVIKSKSENNAPKHIALKVNDNKYWTISAIKGGSELEIGILENGESRSIVSFNENTGLSLNEALNLEKGLKVINRNENQIRGIATTGFKGFEEGRLLANGNWQKIEVDIAENTVAKYKLQAWLIQDNNKPNNRYSHLETDFIFFPEEIEKRIKCQVAHLSTWTQKLYTVLEWGLRMLKMDDYFIKIVNEEKAGKWRARMEVKVDDQRNIYIKSKSIIDPNEKLIYYSIERLWEGKNWIDYK